MFAEPRGFPVVGIAVLARCTGVSAVRGHCRGAGSGRLAMLR